VIRHLLLLVFFLSLGSPNMPTTDALDSKSPTAHPRYDEYEESGVDWLGEIPAHWKTGPLKYFVSIDPQSLSEDTDDGFQLRYVDIGSVSSTGEIEEPKEYRFEDAPSRARKIVQHGDTIISTVRTYLKAIAYIEDPPENLVVSTGFAVLRPGEDVDERFLGYLIRSKQFLDSAVSHSEGIGYPSISTKKLGRLPVWLPSLPEQKTIAAYLDRETERIDALIEKKEQLIDLLEEKRNSLISRVVTKGLDDNVEMKDSEVEWLGEIPAHWEIGKTGHILENLDSERIPVSASNRSEMQGEYPYYGASGVIDHVDDYLFDEPLILVAEDGANLFSRSTPLAFIARGKYWVNNHAHVLRPRYEPLEYWAYVLRSIVYDPWILGAAQPKLTQENLGSIELPMPPKEERMRITERLNDEKKEINNLTERVEEAIDRLKEYRTALISAAVTGQIDVREEIGKPVGHQNS
jgi:type I restriction enzyme S subunit